MKTVGRELGVKHVLEGSVRRMGDQVRINAQLIDAATGGHLWAERYDGAAEDIFALQEEVLGKIVASLAITLTPKEKAQIERVPTGDLKAYEIYRHAETALAHLNHQTQNWTSPATEALSLYESAIARDPSFAAAYAGDAYVAYNVWRHDMWWVMLGSKSLARAKASAARALDLDPSNARAHGVLALIDLSDGDYDSAIARAREAVTSDPNAVESHVFLARILSWSGEHEKAFSAIETATRLDPKPKSWVEAIRGWVLFNARQYDRAVEPLEWVRNEVPTSYTNRVVLAATYAQLNRLEEANAEASKAIEIDQLSNVTLQVERQSAAAYRNSVDLEHWIDALRVAGVPEWPFGFEGRDEDRLTDEQLRALVFGGNTMRLRVWKNRKELWPNVAFMTIASDGHYRYRSRNNPDQEDWDFVFGGRSEVRDGMLCSASPEVRRGKFECARYYRNPNGTREERNEYISVHPNWVIYQSPE